MTALHEKTPAAAAMIATIAQIGSEVAGPVANDVDRAARFPGEAIDALRVEGALAALVPSRYGGAGLTYGDVSAMCCVLGQHCSSAGMVFAMHQIQVACIVEHAQGDPYFDDLLAELAASGFLIASATTEAAVGGDVRSSVCAVETEGDTFELVKDASVISYGEFVDDVLVTARRNPDAPPNDQVLVHVRRPGLDLEPVGVWDTLGMRGTCSIGFSLHAAGGVEQILPSPYADISGQTMLPVSHITWASLWLGIATSAMAKARASVRAVARKSPGMPPPSALRLAAADACLDRIRASLEAAVREFERSRSDLDVAMSLGFAIRMNNLKLSVSQDALAVAQAAMAICGIAGYRNDTPLSVGRELRDLHSAELMVHNDRLIGHNSSLHCLVKEG